MIELYPYRDSWDDDDPHANFKAEVAMYSVSDPLPTLENLSKATGVPVPSLIRYILVKYAVSGSEALMAMTPVVFRQMQEQIEQAEQQGTDAARLQAYEAFKQIVSWLNAAAGSNRGA